MIGIGEVLSLGLMLHELNDCKTIKMFDKYPVVKTELTSVEIWWNKLNCFDKHEVGCIAIYYHKMTADYKWKCRNEDNYEDLTKGQKKIVDFIFSRKNDSWLMFNISGMLKL